MSSLQKAVSRSTGCSLNTAARRRGSNARTATTFEVGNHYESMDVDNTVANTPTTATNIIASNSIPGTHKITRKQHFTIIENSDDNDRNDAMDVDVNSKSAAISFGTTTQTSFVVGVVKSSHKSNDNSVDFDVEQMEGVIDQGTKMPLIVLDGANVAFAYATAVVSNNDGSKTNTTTNSSSSSSKGGKIEPNVRGIQIAMDYFIQAGLRALVVLPAYWFHSKNSTNTITNRKETQTILKALKTKGLVVVSPPTDDDDAYALTIARREENRSFREPRNGEGPGYVLSNDLFRDAQQRMLCTGDHTLKEWLTNGRDVHTGPGRISYTFGNLQTMNDRGEYILDFIPNPRHPLILQLPKL